MGFKIPKAKKLPSGKWHIDMMLGGQRIYITKNTEKECVKKATLLKAQHENGILGGDADTKITIGDAVDLYIDSRSAVLSPSTIWGYKDIRKTRFQEVMDRRISTISNWQNVINIEAKLCSPKTLHNAWGLVRSALGYVGVEIRNIRLPQRIKQDHVFLEPEQIPILISQCSESAVEIQILLGLHGLRRSEIYGLRYENVHDGIIHVRGARVRSEKGYELKKTNKTAQSVRDVPILIPRLSDLLSESTGKGKDLICPNDPTTDYKRINRICEKAGLPLIGFHGLRHSFASLCYHLGISELEAMKLGGWADFGTMRKIYTHLAESDKMEATKKLKDFFNSGGDNT